MSKINPNLIPTNITKEDFLETLSGHKFDSLVGFRSKLYYLISEKLGAFNREANDYKISDDEAILYVAFISQWNRANRKITELDYDKFKEFMSRNNQTFNELSKTKIESLLTENKETGSKIANLAQALSEIAGVGWVGATKILHMRLPNLFVPIDNAIAKQKVYQIKNGKKFGDSYFSFLCKVSEIFNPVYEIWKNNLEIRTGFFNLEKSFAKAIDEYNFLKVHQQDVDSW